MNLSKMFLAFPPHRMGRAYLVIKHSNVRKAASLRKAYIAELVYYNKESVRSEQCSFSSPINIFVKNKLFL